LLESDIADFLSISKITLNKKDLIIKNQFCEQQFYAVFSLKENIK
jgi:hypothetical protein